MHRHALCFLAVAVVTVAGCSSSVPTVTRSDGAGLATDVPAADGDAVARPSPWPLQLPPGVPTTGKDAWRATWQPEPDAESLFLQDLDAGVFPREYLQQEGESLVLIGYQACTDLYRGIPELKVYDSLSDGTGGLPGPSPFEIAQQAREVTAAAGQHLCANVTPGGAAVPTSSAPIVRTGEGDAEVPVIRPGGAGSRALVTITGNDAGEAFTVRGMDGERSVLVDTVEPYTGTVLLDGATTKLEVIAKGRWSITLADVGSAPALAPGVNSGSGDQVFRYERGPLRGVLEVQREGTGRRFQVLVQAPSGLDLLINTLVPYTGQVRVKPDSGLVIVKAWDEWSILLR